MSGYLRAGFTVLMCGTHAASAAWGLRFEVSKNGGATWEAAIDALPGEVISFRFGSYFDETTLIKTASGIGPLQTLSRFTGQNQVAGLSADDAIQNLVARTTNHHASVLSVSGNLIGTTAATSFASNLYVRGLPLTPTYYNAIYTGEIRIGQDSTLRTLTLCNKQYGSGAIAGLTFFNGGYLPKQEIASPLDHPNHIDVLAAVRVIPAPGTLPLLLGASIALRRRRI